MWNSITGEVTGHGPNGVYLSTGGVEWDLETSSRTRDAAEVGATGVRLYTVLVHREDAMRLYGFADSDERTVFLELVSVNGVGPKQAIRVLSSASPAKIATMIRNEDVKGLSAIPGLGAKTAQKIILALEGRIAAIGSPESGASAAADDVVDALIRMGFDRKRAADAVTSKRTEHDDDESVFREALRALAVDGA